VGSDRDIALVLLIWFLFFFPRLLGCALGAASPVPCSAFATHVSAVTTAAAAAATPALGMETGAGFTLTTGTCAFRWAVDAACANAASEAFTLSTAPFIIMYGFSAAIAGLMVFIIICVAGGTMTRAFFVMPGTAKTGTIPGGTDFILIGADTCSISDVKPLFMEAETCTVIIAGGMRVIPPDTFIIAGGPALMDMGATAAAIIAATAGFGVRNAGAFSSLEDTGACCACGACAGTGGGAEGG